MGQTVPEDLTLLALVFESEYFLLVLRDIYYLLVFHLKGFS